MDNLQDEDGLKGDDLIIHEAQRRFNYCEDWEAQARVRFLEDLKFANADSDNKYQWPDAIRANRDVSQRPCLTINKTRQHNLHIINDAKQNTPRVRIIPTGDGSSYKSSQIYEGIVRHIEYISNSDAAYDTATEFQVEAGIGYWRIVTDYAGDDSFDQEIFIRRVKDPLNIYLDPDILEKDGSDARFAFIFDDMPKDEFKEAYPKYADKASQVALNDTTSWTDEHHVRIAEYYRCVKKTDKVVAITNPETGEQETHKVSEMSKELKAYYKSVIDDPTTKYRTIETNEIEWYLIVGETVVDHTTWPGKYIPIVRVVGEETIINGEMDRKGHTRALKDAQRMFNYAASSAVEVVALQSKSPYIAPAQAIEGLETYWNNANTENSSILPYNHIDDDGEPIPMPERAQPPVQSTGFMQMMQDSDRQMDMASGQFEATFGQPSNERSGVAINARQRQGETATYHYIDNLAIAIRYTGKILIDLIPKVYDTPRVIRILAEDGSDSEVQLDPQLQQAHMQLVHQRTEEVKHIFNPNVGKYDVLAEVAPGYATRREEEYNALTQIISNEPSAFMLLGDLWADNSDFPGAPKIAERMRNMLPPQATGKAPSIPPEQVDQMQQQIQKANEINGKLLQKISEDAIKLKSYAEKNDIDAYKAETGRMVATADILHDHILTPKDQAILMHDLAKQEHKGVLDDKAMRYTVESNNKANGLDKNA